MSKQFAAIERLARELESVKSELATVKAERDALIEETEHICVNCAYRHGWDTCEKAAFISDGSHCLNWAWRGVQKGDNE